MRIFVVAILSCIVACADDGSTESTQRNTILFQAPGVVNDLKVDATHVYLAMLLREPGERPTGVVFAIPKDGGEPTSYVVNYDPSAIAVDTERLYVTRCCFVPDVVQTFSLSDGSESFLVNDAIDPQGITFDEEYIYVTVANVGFVLGKHGYRGEVLRVGKYDGSVVSLANSLYSPAKIVVDQQNAYWVDREEGTMWRVPKKGGDPSLMYAGQYAMRIAVDDENVYWLRSGNGGNEVARLAKDARLVMEPEPFVNDHDVNPMDIALDGNLVYFADYDNAIMVKHKSGGGLVRVAEDLPVRPNLIAVDKDSLYWASFGGTSGGDIWKDVVVGVVPKTGAQGTSD